MEFRLDSQVKWRLAAAGSGLAPRAPARLGELLFIAADGLHDSIDLRGFSTPEDNGAWSAAHEAHIDISVSAEARGRALDVVLWLRPFVEAGPQAVRLKSGDDLLGTAHLDRPVSVRVALAPWSDPRRPLRLTMELPSGATPESVGLGEDRRRLSVKLVACAVLRRDAPVPAFEAAAGWPAVDARGPARPTITATPQPAASLPPLPQVETPVAVQARFAVGAAVGLRSGQAFEGVSFTGFAAAGPEGRWSIARQARVDLAWAGAGEALALDLLVAAYVPDQHAQDISFAVDGAQAGRLIVEGGDAEPILVRLPVSGDQASVELSLPRATSPRAEGESIDDRPLGIRVIALSVGPRGAAPVSALRPPGSAFVDMTAEHGIVSSKALARSSGGVWRRLRRGVKRRMQATRHFFVGGIEGRTRMAAQMSGDAMRAVQELARGLDERNEAVVEAMRSAAEAQTKQMAARFSELRSDLDMRVASINAAISALASRQSALEESFSKTLAGSSDALKTGFGSLSASMRRQMAAQADQGAGLTRALDALRADLAGDDDRGAGLGRRIAQMESALSEQVAGALAQMRTGLFYLADVGQRGQAGGETRFAALSERLDELAAMVRVANEAGASGEAQRGRVLAQVSQEITAFRADVEARIQLLGDTTRQFSGAAMQLLHQHQDTLGEAADKLTALQDGAASSALAGEMAARFSETSERLEQLRVQMAALGATPPGGALTEVRDDLRAMGERLVASVAVSSGDQAGLAAELREAMRASSARVEERLENAVQGHTKTQAALTALNAQLAALSEAQISPAALGEIKTAVQKAETAIMRENEMIVSAHQKLDATAHRLIVDLDAQTKAVRTAHGFVLVPRMDARLLLLMIEAAGAYEPGVSAVFQRFVGEGMRVADVGANIGFHTLHLARLVGPRGRVTAVEPISDLAKLIARMLDLNGVGAWCDVVASASGYPARRQALHVGMTSGHSSLFELPQSAGTISVDVRPLDDILPAGTQIDFVKIDAEGAEREIFTGMSGVLRNPDIAIVMEFAPAWLRRAGTDPRALLSDIARAGFETFVIENPSGALTPETAERLLAMEGCNLFLIRRLARNWALTGA